MRHTRAEIPSDCAPSCCLPTPQMRPRRRRRGHAGGWPLCAASAPPARPPARPPEVDRDLAVLRERAPRRGAVHLADQHVEDAQAQQVVRLGAALRRGVGCRGAGADVNAGARSRRQQHRRQRRTVARRLLAPGPSRSCSLSHACPSRARTVVPFSRKPRASSARPRYASSSNQPSLVMRASSWMRLVATNGSSCGPRLRVRHWDTDAWRVGCCAGAPAAQASRAARLQAERQRQHPLPRHCCACCAWLVCHHGAPPARPPAPHVSRYVRK